MKQITILTILALGLLLSACDYHLRGYQSVMHAMPSNPIHITLPNSAQGFGFRQALKNELSNVGFTLSDNATDDKITQINIHSLDFHQFRLVGTLTEVRVVGVIKVSYQLPQGNKTQTITAERSYQYNEASVAGSNKQDERTRKWLEEELARRIAEQYHALIQSNHPIHTP